MIRDRSILDNVDWGTGAGLVTGSAAVLCDARGLTGDEEDWLFQTPILVSPFDAI